MLCNVLYKDDVRAKKKNHAMENHVRRGIVVIMACFNKNLKKGIIPKAV